MKSKTKINAIIIAILAISIITVLGTNSAYGLNKIKDIEGTVYFNPENKLWEIVANDGKHYQPSRMPLELQKPGLKIKISAVILWDAMEVIIVDYQIIQTP